MDRITDTLATIVDYLELFENKTPELDNGISRLKEALFWLNYYIENEEV